MDNLYSMYGNMTQVMFGAKAIHIPMWMVVQHPAFVGGSLDPALKYGSEEIHQLILGEIIVRPHIIVASNNFAGHGISGFVTDNPSALEWLEGGNVIYQTELGISELARWR